MKILVTGASGRVGRAIYVRLAAEHTVVGLDRSPSSTADVVATLSDAASLATALRGCDAVVHVAALHAPHVGVAPDDEFERINVRGTSTLARLAAEAGARSFVFTSTTAVYGLGDESTGAAPSSAAWIDEQTAPRPRTVYHRTKLAAEHLLAGLAGNGALRVTVIRMGRCFPEPAPVMAVQRLHRGIDVRDVADAHAAALARPGEEFRLFVVSGATPFLRTDASELARRAPAVIAQRAPALVEAFRERGWKLPAAIDRVYSPARAEAELGWRPAYGFDEVLAELDRRSSEVLPPRRAESR